MLEAVFTETTLVVTLTGLFQWDYGQKLYIKGLDMSDVSEVHFSNTKEKEAIVMPAVKDGEYIVTSIPDVLLTKDLDITAWVYDVQPTSGETIRTITLKVQPRTKPNNFTEFVPDGEIILGDVINLVNENIADNEQFKTDLTQDFEEFKAEVGTVVSEGVIDDSKTDLVSTWSSQKINTEITNAKSEVNEQIAGIESEIDTIQEQIAGGLGSAVINDETVTTEETWSSNKITSEINTVANDLEEFKSEAGTTYATKISVANDIKSLNEQKTLILPTSGWVANGSIGYTQLVATDTGGQPLGYDEDSSPLLDVATLHLNSGATARTHIEEWSKVYGAVAGTNGITFTADEKPSVDLRILAKGK